MRRGTITCDGYGCDASVEVVARSQFRAPEGWVARRGFDYCPACEAAAIERAERRWDEAEADAAARRAERRQQQQDRDDQRWGRAHALREAGLTWREVAAAVPTESGGTLAATYVADRVRSWVRQHMPEGEG